MPKTIKKRREHDQRAAGEPSVRLETIQDNFTHLMEHRRSSIIQIIVAFFVVVLLAVGFVFYRSGGKEHVLDLEARADRAAMAVPQGEAAPGDVTLAKALELYGEAANEGSVYGAFQEGVSQLKLGQYDSAYDTFAQVADSSRSTPYASMARIKMATIRLRQDKPDEALAILEPVFTDTVSGDTALFLAADILERTDRKEESLERLRELVERFPTSSWVPEARTKLPSAEQTTAAERADSTPGVDPSDENASDTASGAEKPAETK
jgi:predicted negative regulator of RcsB-dependent stress response